MIVFDDPRFVDTDGWPWAESDNVQASLQSLGHTAIGTWDITSVPGDILLFPEFEKADLTPYLTAAQRATLSNYVINGGSVIIHGNYTDPARTTNFLNIFGLSVMAQRHPFNSTFLIVTQSVGGTSFASGPWHIGVNVDTVGLSRSSLPPRAVPIYQSDTYAGVVIFHVGDGRIIYLGWDWDNAAPRGDQNNGWLSVLGAAVTTLVTPKGPTAPFIEVQPRDQAVFAGNTARFSVSAFGTRPLHYEWQFNDATISGATNAELTLLNVTTSNIGRYSVTITNRVGSITSETCRLRILNFGIETFQIVDLGTNNSRVIEHGNLTGDRGGIAASSSHIVYIGDTAPALFRLDDLSGGRQTPFYDLIASDLSTERLYALSDGTNAVPTLLTQLIELTSDTALPTGRRITLGLPIAFQSGGIFSGWKRIVVHSGTRAYSIELPSGTVIDLGVTPLPAGQTCQHRAFWGIAEQFDNAIHLAYVQDYQTISRTRLPNGPTTAISTFRSLGDMCSFTVAPAIGRWYFHHENASQFGGIYETLGYADANFNYVAASVAPEIRVQPRNRARFVGDSVTFEVRVAGADLHYQWLFNGFPISGANTTSLSIASVNAANQGLYSVVVTNLLGRSVSSNATLEVFEQGPVFRIASLTPNNSEVIAHTESGAASYGLAASASHIFASTWQMLRAPLTDLARLERVDTPYSILASDLLSERVFVLAAPQGFPRRITALVELDGETGLANGTRLELSEPIDLASSNNGIFAGWGRIVVHNGTRVYSIELPSASVIDLGPMVPPYHHGSTHFFYTGVAEYHSGAIHIAYVQYFAKVVRARVPDGLTTELATFRDLGPMLQFAVSPALGRWYFDTQGSQFRSFGNQQCLGFAEATFEVPAVEAPPRIRRQPRDLFVFPGSGSAIFSVIASGSDLHYQWLFNGSPIPGANTNSLTLGSLTDESHGIYSVIVSNSFGIAVSSNALLTLIESGPEFAIAALTTNNLYVVDQGTALVSKQGGLAISSTDLFSHALRFELPDLATATRLSQYYIFPVSDLLTETVYLLGDETSQIGFDKPVTSLLEVNGSTGEFTGGRINLSQPILLQSSLSIGVFAGYGRVVLHAGGHVYSISIPSGVVVDLGSMAIPRSVPCVSGPHWGVAELVDGSIHLVYMRDPFTIVRTRIPDGLTRPVATFHSLSNTCSFTVSVNRRAWYFHYDGGSQFAGTRETLGFAEAIFNVAHPPQAAVIVRHPQNTTVLQGGDAFLSTTTSGRVEGYQWLRNNLPIPQGTNRVLRIRDAALDDTGAYAVVVSNSAGIIISSNALLSVIRAEADFRIISLSGFAGRVLDCDVLRGHYGISSSDSHNFFFDNDIAIRLGFTEPFRWVYALRRYETMVSELASGTVYVLDGPYPVGPGSVVNGLLQIDGVTGLPTGNRINLSTNITLGTNGVGLFAGFGRVGIYDGHRLYEVVLPSGLVIKRGPVPHARRFSCSHWVHWGVLEYFTNTVHLAYVQDATTIVRRRVPDGAVVGTIASFLDLGNMCSFGLSLRPRRWTFAYNGASQFGSGDSMIGYAPAAFVIGNSPPLISRISNANILEDGTITVPFSIFDSNTAADLLTINYSSSNTNLVLPGSIVLGGAGTARTIAITPLPERSGLVVITLNIRDREGLTAARSFELTVVPVNDPPVAIAFPASLTLAEDTSASVALFGTDPEGTLVTLAGVTQPQHGVLHKTPADPPQFIYEPNLNYNGIDSFQFRVSDGTNYSDWTTVSITVTPVNDAPTAVASAWSLTALATNDTNVVILAPDNITAEVIFDGSLSSDIDNDELRLLWFEAGKTNAFATGLLVTNSLPIGSYEIFLEVHDSDTFDTARLVVELISPVDAVAELILAVDESDLNRRNKRALIASLRAAMVSFDRGNHTAAINQLRAYQNKVDAQVFRENPTLAAHLISQAQALIAALSGSPHEERP